MRYAINLQKNLQKFVLFKNTIYICLMITLKQSVIDEIKESQKLRLAIQNAIGISHTSLYKYLKNNSPLLTNANALKAIIENSEYKSEIEILDNN
jgi:hypothetical protein